MSRRGFLAGSGLVVGGALGLGGLSGCARSGEAEPTELFVANWPDYIDTGKNGTVARFSEATGIHVTYAEVINDNAGYFGKIAKTLSRGGRIDADVVVFTGETAAKMIEVGWAQRLPLDRIPNAGNLVEELRNPPWDPTGRYTLPYQSGMVVLAYNSELTDVEVKTPSDLLDSRLAGKVALLNNYPDTLGLFGIEQGIDVANPRLGDFYELFDTLTEATRDGQITRFTGNDYLDLLADGEIAACIGWSGDVAQVSLDNPNIHLVVPEAGTTVFSDSMVLISGSPNIAAAAEWMNFLYDPNNAARVTEWVQYMSPVAGVADRLAVMGDEAAALAKNPWVNPDAETRAKLSSFGLVAPVEQADFEERYSAIVRSV